MTMATGFIYDADYLKHDTGLGHPESPARLTATMEHLQSLPWFKELKQLSPLPCELSLVEANHAPDYIARVNKACQDGERFLDSLDTAICEESFEIALLAAGGLVVLADGVMNGELRNGFALVRPPGHHAEKNMALGFCLFNNVAILARYVQQQYGLENVLILDWDVHHGNGTQHAFYDDPSVLYISMHQSPYYPGTGAASETGAGNGVGETLNCPMPAGSGDREYQAVFEEQILPKIDGYEPDFIIISAGFDGHRDDPLAQMNLSTEFFGWMTKEIMQMADKHCEGRIVSSLEGGYDLRALPLSIAEHLRVLKSEV